MAASRAPVNAVFIARGQNGKAVIAKNQRDGHQKTVALIRGAFVLGEKLAA